MAVENESINVYLRAVSDPSGFRQFAREQEAALRSIGALTEQQASRINAAISGVESRSLTTVAGLRELGTAINAINPQRLRELANLGFDQAGLARATQQLGQIETLLASIQSKQNAITRNAAGLGVSSRYSGQVAAITGGSVPQITPTGDYGPRNAVVYSIASSLGTQFATGQAAAMKAGNAALIAELSLLRTALLTQVAAAAPAIEQRSTPTAVADTRANTSAITANTAAINRLIAAATGRGPAALPPGTPPRPVTPQGPFSPPSGALYFSAANISGLASALNNIYGRGQPQGLTGSPAAVRPSSAFAVDSSGAAIPLGAYTPDIAQLRQVVAARREIAALDALEASRKSGITRDEAIRETRLANEAILRERLSSNPIVDDVSPYIGPTGYSTLLNSGVIRGRDLAKIPEEGLAALGFDTDPNYYRQQRTASFPVPGLANYRDYAAGANTLGFADAERRAQLQNTVNAIEDGPLRQALFTQQGVQVRNVRIAQEIARAYERIGAADQQKLAALNAANRAAIQRVLDAPRPVGEVAGRYPAGPSFYPPALPAISAGPTALRSPALQEISSLVQEVRTARAAVASVGSAPRLQVDPRAALLAKNPNLPPEALDQLLAMRATADQLAPRVSEASSSRDQEIAAAKRLAAAEDALATALRARAGVERSYPALNAAAARTITDPNLYTRSLPPGMFTAGAAGVLPPGPGLPPPPTYPGPYGYQRPPLRAITAGPDGAYVIRQEPVFTQTGYGGSGGGSFYGGSGGGVPPSGGMYGSGGGGYGGPPRGVGGFFEEFGRGFRGLADKSYAFQVGQVAKFSLLYGAAYTVLFQLSRGIQTVITQAIAFQESLSSLATVTGQSKEEVAEFASDLGQTATQYGLQPGVGVEAGAKAIGIFGLDDLPEQVRNYQAKQVAEIATAQQFLSGATPEETIQNLGAIGGAYQLDPAALERVADLDAYITRELGTGVGTTLETLAQTGTLAQSAGFSLEEAQVLSGIVRQRTGQTPAATAGLLSQFYGRAGDPQLREQLAGLGIDVTGTTFAQQIKELALLNQQDPQVRNALENSFGRGRGKGAVGNVIEELGAQGQATRLLQEAEEGAAAGAQDAALQKKLDNIGGQIDQFIGKLQELAVNVGESGLLEAFGAAIFVLDNFVELLNNILGPFSELPGAIRLAVIGLTALAVASRTGVAGALAGNLASRGGFIGPTTNALRGPGSALGAVGLRGLAAGALSYAGPIAAVTAAIGLLDTFGQMNANAEEYRQAIEDGDAALASNLSIFDNKGIASSTTYEGIASAAQSQIDAIRKEASDKSTFLGIPIPGTAPEDVFGTGTPDKQVRGLEADIAFATARAQIARREEAKVLAEAGSAVFTDPTNLTNVSETLELLSASGVSATEQMRLLSNALFGVSEEGEKARFEIDRRRVAGDVAEELSQERDFFGQPTVDAASGTAGRSFLGNVRGYLGLLPPIPPSEASKDILGEVGSGEFGVLPGVGYSGQLLTDDNPLYDIFRENATEITDTIFSSLPKTVGKKGLSSGQYERVADAVVAYLQENGVDDAESRKEDILLLLELIIGKLGLGKPGGSEGLNTKEIFGAVSGLQAGLEQNLAALVPGDFEGTEKAIRQALRKMQRVVARAKPGEDISAALQIMDQVRYDLITQKIEENERLLRAAQQGKSDAEVARLGNQFGRRNLRLAAKSGSIQTIINVMSQMNRNAVNQVKATLQAALEVAKAALERREALYQALAGITLRRTADGNLGAGAAEKVDSAQQKVDEIQSQIDALNEAQQQVVYENTYADPDGSIEEDTGPTQAQIDAARAIAEATRRAGQVPLATAQLQSARADLAAAEEGTVEYYQALAGVYEAQRALAEAIREQNITKFLLANDITDPVVEARAELKRAQRTLAYDQRQGASPDQIQADRLEVRRQEANLQATKFSQWMSELQTAEQLERISQAQYIRMLERRAQNLREIKKRTQQEQEQLDEVLLALKAAREGVSSQFNLGDIKVPTPYEVRRFIEQARANAVNNATGNGPRTNPGATGGGRNEPGRNAPGNIGNTINNEVKNYVNVDGADTAQIIRILRDILGNNAIKSTATKTGKR